MGHHHHKRPDNIRLAFFLNLGFTLFEIIGGFYVNSVAILSDALHDLGDSLSLGLSWYLERKSKKSSTKEYTFGYQRFSLLGALINSLILILGSGYVIYAGIRRLIYPEHSDAQGMLFFALIGIAVNGYGAFKLGKGGSLNEKVLQWHLLEDVLGWVAVLIVSLVLLVRDIPVLDPLLSLVITLYVLWNVLKRLRETMRIFLQGAPEKIDMDEIKAKIKALPNVASLHHAHIWSLDGEHHVLSAHIKLKKVQQVEEILQLKNRVKELLKSYDLEHVTIETEFDQEECGSEVVKKAGEKEP